MRSIALILLISIAISCQTNDEPSPVTTGQEGKPLPVFNIQLVEDSTRQLTSTSVIQGKELVLFYFRPYCQYCRAQMRDMVNNLDHFRDKQLLLLSNSNLSDIRDFINYFGLGNRENLTIGRDTGSFVLNFYRQEWLPFTAYFDKNQYLKTLYSGRLHKHALLTIQ